MAYGTAPSSSRAPASIHRLRKAQFVWPERAEVRVRDRCRRVEVFDEADEVAALGVERDDRRPSLALEERIPRVGLGRAEAEHVARGEERLDVSRKPEAAHGAVVGRERLGVGGRYEQ